MGIEIREAVTSEDRLAVYRFRYEVYVNEMNRVQEYADHVRRMIEEPLDENGHILAAFEGKSIVGTARVNYAAESDIGYYSNLYAMRSFAPLFPAHTCINTKLMVAPKYRSSSLGLRLSKASYVLATGDGMRFDFIDCNTHLVDYFSRLGYRQIRPDIVHPEYGRVHPMVLVTHDLAHLVEVKSPFASLAKGDDFGSVEFFYSNVIRENVTAA